MLSQAKLRDDAIVLNKQLIMNS